MAVSHVKSDTIADATGTVTFWDGVTTSSQAATNLVRPSDWNSAHNQFITLAGNTAGVSTVSGTNIVFAGSNNVTLSGIQGANIATINFSAAAGGGSINISAGTTSNNLTNFVLADGNGVSFGLAGSTVTATVRTNYASSSHSHAASGQNGSFAFDTLSFSNANGISFGTSAGNAITASHNALTSQSNQAVSGQNGSFAFQTLGFSNANGISFGTSAGSSITASHNGLTTARASNDGVGLNTAQSNVTWTVNSSGISIDARNYAGTGTTFNGANVSGSMTVNSNGVQLSLSAAAGGGAGDGVNILAAGTQTANTTGTIKFADSNGITFGMSASTQITATVRTDYASSVHGHSDKVGTVTAQSNVTWTVNSDGISLNANGYAGTGFSSTTTGGTAIVGTNATNGLSIGVPLFLTTAMQSNAATISNIRVSAGTTSNLLSAITFADSNGISFGINGSTLTGTVKTDYAGSNHPHVFSAAGGSSNFTTLGFSDTNGVSFSNSNGSVVATVRTDYASSVHGHTATMFAVSNTTQSSSGTANLNSIQFAGAGIASVGVTNGSVVISVPSGGGAGDGGVFAGVSNLGNTAGSTGTVSTGNFVLVGSNGITLSQSTGGAGSAATITIIGGGGATIGGREIFPAGNNTTFSSHGQNSIYLQKFQADANYSFNNFELRMSGSFASSTNSQVVAYSINYGLYSLETNNSYISLATSLMVISASYNSNTAMGYTISQGAASFTTTSAGTAIASLMSGFKHLYLPFTSTITQGGKYAFVMNISSATTVNTAPFRMALLNQTIFNNLTIGKIHATTILASNASFVGDFNQGVYSATSSNIPASIAVTGLTNAVSQARLYLQLDV